MNAIITAVHIVTCLLLILVVLLQSGKGADMGAAFGGGASTQFGLKSGGDILTKLTTLAAITFMLTSLSLAVFSSQQASVFDGVAEPAPIAAPAAADPVAADPIAAPIGGVGKVTVGASADEVEQQAQAIAQQVIKEMADAAAEAPAAAAGTEAVDSAASDVASAASAGENAASEAAASAEQAAGAAADQAVGAEGEAAAAVENAIPTPAPAAEAAP